MNEKLNINDIKIIYCVKEFNDIGLFPHISGVIGILKGDDHPLLIKYSYFNSYQTCSLSSKRISLKTTFLIRNGFLYYHYQEGFEQLFLRMTDKGRESIEKYALKNNFKFKKTKKEKLIFFV